MGGLFRRHKFKASPLSLAVPLDGSDTVTGLIELQRQQDGYNLAKALHIDTHPQGTKKQRPWRQRYKGPFLSQLTPDDFRAEPRSWIAFLLGRNVWQAYNVPEHINHLCERTEENLMVYLANYLRVALLLSILIMLTRPWAALGLASVVCLVNFKLTVMASPVERQLPVLDRIQLRYKQLATEQQRQQGQQRAEEERPPGATSPDPTAEALNSILTLACYVFVIYTNLLGAFARWCLLTLVVVTSHAALRRSPSEAAEVLLRPPSGLRGQSNHILQEPGVAFAEVLGLQSGLHEDPRRVFREAWALGSSITAAAGAYCWHASQHYCYNAWFNLPSFTKFGR